jgi:1,4-dihydroxy-2-naphthoate octaprenyltransferase
MDALSSMSTAPVVQKLNAWQVWLLAARPKTLPAAASPVIVGSAVAYWEGCFRLDAALAALFGALLLQIGANLANDVFDFYRGADTAARLGPLRVTQARLLTPRQVLFGMWLCFGLAALCGIYLTLIAGWVVILIGLASILAAVAYTGGPFPLGYHGLGDLTVFLFFGVAAVLGTAYVQTGQVSQLALWSSLPMGFLITAILVVNNLRDIETDRVVGKQTLAVRWGARGARWEYLVCVLGAYIVPLMIWVFGVAPAWLLLSWLSIPVALSLVRFIWRETGRALNHALGGTGRLTLFFALFYAAGLVIGKLSSLV